jgi:predicted Zn-ribbon and HTH transcriptional regulator
LRCSEKWSINCDYGDKKIQTIYEEVIEKNEILKEQNDNSKMSDGRMHENKKCLHTFRDVIISIPTRCENCEKFIFGLYKQSVVCESK